MKIKISSIEQAILHLLNELKKKEDDEIELSKDAYWCISNEELYDPYKEPVKFTLGQLSDDWDELCKLIDNNYDGAIMYDLNRMANLLIAISIEKPTSI